MRGDNGGVVMKAKHPKQRKARFLRLEKVYLKAQKSAGDEPELCWHDDKISRIGITAYQIPGAGDMILCVVDCDRGPAMWYKQITLSAYGTLCDTLEADYYIDTLNNLIKNDTGIILFECTDNIWAFVDEYSKRKDFI